MCYTKSDDVGQTYAKYGKTRGCRNGKGDEWWQMNVYEIGESDIIFWLGNNDNNNNTIILTDMTVSKN